MRPESKKYLYDMRQAALLLLEFSKGKTFEDYIQDVMLRSAVERQFEVLGEALSQLSRLDPDVAGRIPERRRIIAFRNVLVHGYASVDDRIVWGVLKRDLPDLLRQVEELLPEGES